MIIIGSTALKYFNLNRLEPKDVDVWADINNVFLWRSAKIDVSFIPKKILILVPTEGIYATPDAIYTIKCSHFAYDIKWEKTKKDILWLKAKGCVLIPELYKKLTAYWKIEHGNKSFLTLQKSADDFFNDAVVYKYSHDFLHSLVSFPLKPVYEHCLKDGQDVYIDKKKFYLMPKAQQLKMFKEEITVIAVERWLVSKKTNWFKAYSLALKKTITNLTKNWACDFIIANLDFYQKADFSYFKHILTTLNLEHNPMKNEHLQLLTELHGDLCTDCGLTELVFALAQDDFDDISARAHAENTLSDWGYCLKNKEGGGEGQAEYCTSVFNLKGLFYRVAYSYASYDGFDFDDILETLVEVTPKTVEVVEFTAVEHQNL